MLLASVNIWAVLLATVVSFILGWLWYGPLFGKAWMKLMNFDKKTIKSMQLSATTAMILGFISYLLLAWVLAQFIGLLSGGSMGEALKVGFWVWLGFIVTTTLGSFLWEGKTFNLWIFNNVYHLINILLMSAIISYW